MASTADNRSVGVYSSNLEMRSIALGSALRNTWWTVSIEDCRDLDMTYFVKGMRLDLREFVLHIIRVHGSNLIAGGGAEDFDNFDELIDAGFSREQGLTEHEFRHDASSGPNIWRNC